MPSNRRGPANPALRTPTEDRGSAPGEAAEAALRRRSRATRRVVFAMLLTWLAVALVVVAVFSLS